MIYWYKLESRFGPGTQERETRYLFFERELKKEELEDYEQEEAHRISRLYDCSCYTDLQHIDTPPPDVVTELRSEAIARIKSGLYVLEKLT